MMKLKNALACVALASFALAQPVAAATRSYESLPQSGIQQPLAGSDRAASPLQDAEAVHGGIGAGLLILLIAGGIAALIAAGGGFGHGNDSTG